MRWTLLAAAAIGLSGLPVTGQEPDRPRLVAQLSHTGPVLAIAARTAGDSRDGLVLTGGVDGTARLWETGRGKLLRTFHGHEYGVTSVAFSPDGRRILTGSADRSARLWDLATGEEIGRFAGHTGDAVCAVFSPDGRHVLTGGGSLWDSFDLRPKEKERAAPDPTVRLWDVETRAEIRRFEGHGKPVLSVAFSPDGEEVLTGSWDGTARIWKAGTGQEIGRLERPELFVLVAYASGRPLALSALRPGELRLRDVRTGEDLEPFPKAFWSAFAGDGAIDRSVLFLEGRDEIPTVSFAFSPGARLLATGRWDGTGHVWRVGTKETVTLEGSTDRIAAAALSPDGRLVAAGTADGPIRLWDLSLGREAGRLGGHTTRVRSLAFSPDGRRILSTSDRTARLHDVETGKEIRRLDCGPAFRSAGLSRDGGLVLAVDWDGALRAWDASTSVETLLARDFGEDLPHLAFSRDRRMVVGWEDYGEPVVVETSTLEAGREAAEERARQVEARAEGPLAVALSPDGRLLLATSEAAAVLWDVAGGAEVRRLEGHDGDVKSVAFSGDGRLALTGGADGTARLWDVATGAEVRRFGAGGEDDGWSTVTAVTADGRLVVDGREKGAVLLWDATTGIAVRRFPGDGGEVTAVAVSDDGSRVVAGGADGTIRLLDVGTGEGRRMAAHGDHVDALVFSPDAKLVLSRGLDGTARLWNTETGEEVRRFEDEAYITSAALFRGRYVLTGTADGRAFLWSVEKGTRRECLAGDHAVTATCFSPGGGFLAMASGDGSVWILDVAGRDLASVPGPAKIRSVALSSDGRRLLTASAGDVALWDIASRERVRTFGRENAESVAFSADERSVIAAAYGGEVAEWDVETGKEIRAFEPFGEAEVHSAVFSPDGRLVLGGHDDGTVSVWDAASGRGLRRLRAHGDGATVVACSPDGRLLLTGTDANDAVRLFDAATGAEVRRFDGPAETRFVAFSADGRLALAEHDSGVRVWDAATGAAVRRYEGGDAEATACFSSDGRLALVGSGDGSARLWDLEAGEEVRRFEGRAPGAVPVALSPDGRRLLMGHVGATLRDVGTGEVLQRLRLTRRLNALAFSPDGLRALAGGREEACLWDLATGEKVRSFGHADVEAVAFAADGKTAWTASLDGSAALWDMETGEEIRRLDRLGWGLHSVACSGDGDLVVTSAPDSVRIRRLSTGTEVRILGFRDGSWAVVDSEGRYAASGGGDVEGLHWVVGNEPIALEQLKERYYDPGLLAKHMGLSEEPLREVRAFAAPKLYPDVAIVEREGRFVVRLRNRGGGIGRVAVKVNGVERAADARGPGADPDAAEATIELDLADDPRVKPGESNRIEVSAYNAEGYLRSRGLHLDWKAAGEPGRRAPELWGIVAGISDYRGDAMDLRYAAKDAQDIATALTIAGERLFGKERLHLLHLRDATRADLVAALGGARAARPEDLLVVYLAGHGVNFGGQEGDYFFLCADASSQDLKDPAVRAAVALSSDELTAHLNGIPALKRVLVLDTCASGRLVEKLGERGDVPSSQVRAMERLKDRTGFFVLAGCAADRVSYEASRYAQGLLTYSLLLGMRGAALKEEEYVDVLPLLGYAADEVPRLAAGIGGIQRPVVAAPRGGASFAIGRLTLEDKAKVPLERVRPMVLRSNFQEERRPRDTLGLAKLVDERLRAAAARGREAALVFIDASECPDACEIGGRYRVEGERVAVEATVFRGAEEIGTFTAEGPRGDLDALAARIVAAAEPCLR